jgi:hypothetical protein
MGSGALRGLFFKAPAQWRSANIIR